MNLSQADIQKEIDLHKKSLEEYNHYKETVGETDENKSVADTIMDCDFESEDFNIGFEQGYIRGMEVLLSQAEEVVAFNPRD